MSGNASIDVRDRGLALISRLNRWMIAGAVALTGAISIIAKESFHGRTLSSSGSVSQGSASSSTGSSISGSSSGIQAPAQSPSSLPAPVAAAPVVSGGS